MVIDPGQTETGGEQGGKGALGEDVSLDWDKSAETVILSAYTCCGFVPQVYLMNYIPELTLWGDGRAVWVQVAEDGSRSVFEGRLSEEELRSFLQKIEETGFFDWQERYENPLVADAADKCIKVVLQDASKTVCEYFEGAPQAFHDLYAELAQGAGAQGSPYVPERGYLTSYLLGGVGQPVSKVDMEWAPEKQGVSLREAGQGVWVREGALEQAWQQVNLSSFGMVLQEGDSYYQISVQVPGLSFFEPDGS